MKFTKYVVIGTFIFCFIVIISALGTRYYKDNLIKDNPLESNSNIENVVKVDGKLYYSTGEESKKQHKNNNRQSIYQTLFFIRQKFNK